MFGLEADEHTPPPAKELVPLPDAGEQGRKDPRQHRVAPHDQCPPWEAEARYERARRGGGGGGGGGH